MPVDESTSQVTPLGSPQTFGILYPAIEKTGWEPTGRNAAGILQPGTEKQNS